MQNEKFILCKEVWHFKIWNHQKNECFGDDDNLKNLKYVKCATIEKVCNVTSKSNDWWNSKSARCVAKEAMELNGDLCSDNGESIEVNVTNH
jgi:hypothetical protein